MDEKNMAHRDVPYLVYEATQARHERTIKRVVIALIIAIILIFVSNAIWLWAWTQYDYTSTDTTYWQDGGGVNAINTRVNGDMLNEPVLPQENESEIPQE